MTAAHDNRPLWWRVAVPAVAAIVLFAPTVYLAILWQNRSLDLDLFAREWGLLEQLQVVLTLVAACLFYLSWRNGKGPVRVAGGALAMLSAAAFVREIDAELGTKAIGWDWLVWLGEHGLQDVLLVAMTLPILVYLFVQRRYIGGVVRLALRWQAWPLYLAGILVLLCVYLDERIVHNLRMRFWEELIETYSYVFLVIASWRHLELVHDETWNRDDA